MEKIQENPTIILDGAHNAQKLEALFRSLPDKNTVLVLGMLRSKTEPEIFTLLRNHPGPIVLTEPNVYGKEALPANELAKEIGREDISLEPEPKTALDKAKTLTPDNGSILVTGSLYLVGNIRELYYPSASILEQRTSWPHRRHPPA